MYTFAFLEARMVVVASPSPEWPPVTRAMRPVRSGRVEGLRGDCFGILAPLQMTRIIGGGERITLDNLDIFLLKVRKCILWACRALQIGSDRQIQKVEIGSET